MAGKALGQVLYYYLEAGLDALTDAVGNSISGGGNIGGGGGGDGTGGTEAEEGPTATTPYQRPSGATTRAQRDSVQGKPCVDCGEVTSKQVADHKTPLVVEHYQTGTIDRTQMRSLDAVQPQCPTCSARQGAEMSRYSRAQKARLPGQ
jgi:hypothetical protein